MSGACLYRRPSGIYAIRVRVPDRLRAVLGKGEIHVSTGMRDPGAAKVAALKIQHELRRRLMTLDLERLTTSSPLLSGEGLIPLIEAAKAIGMGTEALLGELRGEGADLFTQSQHWRGWRIPDIGDIERDFDGSFILNDIEAHGIEQSLSGIVRAYDPAVTIASLLVDAKAATESVFRFADCGGFWPHEPVTVPLGAWMVEKTAVERIRGRLASRVAPTQKKAPSTPFTASAAASNASPYAKHAEKRFSEVFELLRKHRRWGKDQGRRMETEAGLFIELMGNPALGSIDLETIHAFAECLKRLPSDIYLSRRRFGVEPLRELMKVAAQHKLSLKNETTVRGHVGRIAEVLNFAKDKGMIHSNPAAGFKREWSVAKVARAQDEREAFSTADLSAIFGQSWFANGAGEFTKGGKFTYWRPHYFWLPLLGLTTGGRLNELAQLYVDDVRQTETGTWYLDFNLNGQDKIDGDDSDKRLKTINSIRVVPLHPAVIDAGLPEYVNALRKAGHARLFPELRLDAVKGYGKPAGSWFNERFLGKQLGFVRDGKKTFHSFRHTFITALERLDQNERVMAQIAGHERGRTQSGTRYSKDRSADELKPILDSLKFECLAGIGRFDAQAGLRAIVIAEGRKKRMAKAGGKV